MSYLTSKLLNDFSLFLENYSSYEVKEIRELLNLIREYSNCKNIKAEKNLLYKIDSLVLKRNQFNFSIFDIKSKYVSSFLFSDNELVDKHIWIIKSVISRIKVYKRQKKFTNLLINNINKDGITLIEDFLDKDIYDNVLNEIDSEPFALNRADTKTIRSSNRFCSLINYYPKRLNYSGRVLNKIAYQIYDLGYSHDFNQSNSIINKTSFWQKLSISKNDGDIQKDCHMDTFFPSLKFWYFPYKVKNNLAFRYAKSSNILSLERMHIESEKIKNIVLNYSKFKNNDSSSSYKSEIEGSLRFNSRDLKEMKVDLNSHGVKKNTLIIADVSGFHSRSAGEDNSKNPIRIGIHGNNRHLRVF